MALLKFNDIGIKAVCACVPQTIAYNRDLSYLIPEDDLERVINSIGIEQRRIASDGVCASDLCYYAAKQLMMDNNLLAEDIDVLIFVSQTSDYRQPSTAPILQHRLNLSKDTMAFDINLACSGYVYGLSVAYSFASLPTINNVLLLVGETMSKIVSVHDKVSTPLFGDAGTASLITKGNFGQSTFMLHSDGSGAEVMMIPAGGCRNQTSEQTHKAHFFDDGSMRSDEQFRMDGMEVFNFGMRVEPMSIKKLLSETQMTIDDIDLIIYHQANRMMTDFFSKKLKLSKDKTPYSIKYYGNTSSASIPLTIVTELNDGKYTPRKNTILSGFGAGLSWGSVLLDLTNTNISKLQECE
ncbi:MAG: ketoacyl-ACP synthase III [Paludibacteraceae bacterium]|nr:ketoacyl-ACP synthase III [Paludibacteraceae bacterium]